MAVYPGKVPERSIVPTGLLQVSVQAEDTDTAADRADAINASVDALNSSTGMMGVPYVQYAFAGGQHFTFYK